MSKPILEIREEQVPLLRPNKHDGRDSIDSDGGELWWQQPRAVPQSQPPWRQWLFLVTLTIILMDILAFIVAIQPIRHNHSLAPARLRSSNDYILDPKWDSAEAPTTRHFDWIIDDHDLNPDGVWRPMVLINGEFPGPLIECNEGDEIVVELLNHARTPTSIHWHGLYQNGTNWMDGTVGVTQYPIPPNHSFTYRFNVTGQSGTYYYHSHAGMQASDGLFGPLVVHARDGREKELQKVPYEQDRVVMVSDHYYDPSPQLLEEYLAPGNENQEPVPPSALINGRNVRSCPDLPHRNCSSTGVFREIFDLSSSANTRLRVINAGAFAEFSLQIDEHEFLVTEVDGTDVHPQSIHRLNISPGQRYSIILTPPPQQHNKALYWIRARMITHSFAYNNPELQSEVRGILAYPDPSSHHPSATLPQTHSWPITSTPYHILNTSSLSPVLPLSPPHTSTHTLSLLASFQTRARRTTRAYLNNSSFHQPSTPILHTLLDAPASPAGPDTTLFNPARQLVYHAPGPAPSITLLVQNAADAVLSLHIHGYSVFVLAQGEGDVPENVMDVEYVDRRNPLRRDTVSVQAGGWLVVRWVADNPGVWALRGGVGWHAEAGLGMVFAVGEVG